MACNGAVCAPIDKLPNAALASLPVWHLGAQNSLGLNLPSEHKPLAPKNTLTLQSPEGGMRGRAGQPVMRDPGIFLPSDSSWCCPHLVLLC